MVYLFTILLLINAVLYIIKGSWYIMCFIASIVALTCVIKVKPISMIYVFYSVALFCGGAVFAFALENFRVFIVCSILSLYWFIYLNMCNQKQVPDTSTSRHMEYLHKFSNEYPTYEITKHYYPIDTYQRFKDYFGIIDKYYSASDQGLLDDPEDGVYPLYEYKTLDCKLDQTEDGKYQVYVKTDKGWYYGGTLDKTVALDIDIRDMRYWYVTVTGGSTFIVANGEYEKTWQPLHFTLVIDFKAPDR